MIEWFTTVQVVVGVVAGVGCLVLGFAKRAPDDFTLGATLLVELLLVAQLVIALIAPAVGNAASGSVLEFYIYLISALLLPPLAGVWALVDRTRWATVVLGVVCLAIAVMIYRMNVIWFVQVA